MHESRLTRAKGLPKAWQAALAAAGVVAVGLLVGCLGDSGVDLCVGDDPLPDCVNGVPPDYYLHPSQYNPATSGDADGGDSGLFGDGATASNGCNPAHKPTWDSPVKTIMQNRCVRCHRSYTSTYAGISRWVANGLLRSYTNQGHYIYGSERTTVLSWLDLGAPQSACDVP
ncbi:MAG: hypothetical protein HY903_19445 [Deltaproteobacteria bacterium]|nr:hypothetical protein [Deltaproteobacteria bacterium]